MCIEILKQYSAQNMRAINDCVPVRIPDPLFPTSKCPLHPSSTITDLMGWKLLSLILFFFFRVHTQSLNPLGFTWIYLRKHPHSDYTSLSSALKSLSLLFLPTSILQLSASVSSCSSCLHEYCPL